MAALLPALAAATDPAKNFSPSVSVLETCSFESSAYVLAFGSYDPVAMNRTVDLDREMELRARCTYGVAQRVTIGQGAYPAAGSTDALPLRRMASGTSRLTYQLYANAARTQVWGNTAATGVTLTGQGVYVPLTVYGRIPAGQSMVPKGTYVDFVIVTFSN
jgi:spore coat protein U-like protein